MLSVVIIEEIGLAEISPHNPLKVLHEILEKPKVPTIGISNWALDASKMNRAVNLWRPDPTETDLKQTAKEIA
jgi:nucleoside-triphosphatase THEP1